ncbi:hypothetical protein GOBAR_DD04702 [Gossypium barbadense]|nr:hypothetical protein GOBAR_DD04702 [Gossypium barbadense]
MAFDGFVSHHSEHMQTLAFNQPSSPPNFDPAKCKAEIIGHPMYPQLLEGHVACLRVATPVDQLPKIDAQLARSQDVSAKYSSSPTAGAAHHELDHFMANYVLLLGFFKDELQQHVRVHAMEAVMSCWDLEQSLQSLTETERSLMEHVRQELKHELKQGYKEKIVDVREEILRKRRAGKLPGDTTLILKAWWQSHSKWPYPTFSDKVLLQEEDKARLAQKTGLQLKQINNWFINQRKRNWHNNPSTSLKSKREK